MAEYGAAHWFVPNAKTSRKSLVKELANCLEVMNDFLAYWGLKGFLCTMAVYIERYIREVGKLDASYLFDVLFVGAIIVVKMWEDKHIVNSVFAEQFDIPLNELNTNELNFLQAVDFNFGVSSVDTEKFILKIFKRKE